MTPAGDGGRQIPAMGTRKLFAVLLYVCSALGAIDSLRILRLVRAARIHRADTGDFTGVNLGLAFLAVLAPLSLIALLVALWLWPVSGWLARSRSRSLES